MSDFPFFDIGILVLVLLASLNGARRGALAEGALGGGLVATGALVITPPIATAAGLGHLTLFVIPAACLATGIGMALLLTQRLFGSPSGDRHTMVGAICGGLNCLWIVTFLLAESTDAADSLALAKSSHVASALLTQVEMTLLALSTAVLMLSGLLAVGSARRWLGSGQCDRPVWRHTGPIRSDRLGLRLPVGADEGKLDPSVERVRSITVPMTTSLAFGLQRDQFRRPAARHRKVQRTKELNWQNQSEQDWYRIGPQSDTSQPPAHRVGLSFHDN